MISDNTIGFVQQEGTGSAPKNGLRQSSWEKVTQASLKSSPRGLLVSLWFIMLEEKQDNKSYFLPTVLWTPVARWWHCFPVSTLASLILGVRWLASRIPLGIMKLFTNRFTYEYEILTFIMVHEIFIHEYEMLTYEYVIRQSPQMPACIYRWCFSSVSSGRQNVLASLKQIMPPSTHSPQ